MFEFEYPWLLLSLPLPILVWLIAPSYKESRPAIRTPFFEQLAEMSGQQPTRGAVTPRRTIVQKLLLPAVWLLLIAAIARPVWVGAPITKTESGRDLLLAVDLSGSMEAQDFRDPMGERMRRLDAARQVLDDFISRREGDRIGLIFFGTAAFLQTPFTLDHQICRALLDEAQVRMAGPRTMIGDAIGLAIQLFEQSDVDERVLILLTDGNDTGSKVPPGKAAEIAAERGVRIHAVAIGDPTTVGENQIDEEALHQIANTTGGRFFRAGDREQLDSIYTVLDEIEPVEAETISFRPKRQLFSWPLGAVIVVMLGFYSTMAARSLTTRRGRRRA